MSDEEKKELEILKSFEPDDLVECAIYLQALERITNLIEKQSKEIEELKYKYSDEKIRNTIIKRYREVIEKDYVSKDKIGAKIEDLEKQQKEEPDAYLCIKVLQSLLEKGVTNECK